MQSIARLPSLGSYSTPIEERYRDGRVELSRLQIRQILGKPDSQSRVQPRNKFGKVLTSSPMVLRYIDLHLDSHFSNEFPTKLYKCFWGLRIKGIDLEG